MKEFAVVIPVYRPLEELIDYVNSLYAQDVGQVILVDDGNDESASYIFDQLAQDSRCTILKHEVNLGKGAGLKTAFEYILDENPNILGVVTVDADGQHSVADVVNVGDHLVANENSYILGMREFKIRTTPFRSLLGNTTTSLVFRLLFRKYIKDTQSGLRAFPIEELDELLKLKGERYEYEMNVLIDIVQKNKPFIQVDIETIYHDVHVSYFNTYSDAVRVASTIVKGYLN